MTTFLLGLRAVSAREERSFQDLTLIHRSCIFWYLMSVIQVNFHKSIPEFQTTKPPKQTPLDDTSILTHDKYNHLKSSINPNLFQNLENLESQRCFVFGRYRPFVRALSEFRLWCRGHSQLWKASDRHNIINIDTLSDVFWCNSYYYQYYSTGGDGDSHQAAVGPLNGVHTIVLYVHYMSIYFFWSCLDVK